MKVLIDEGLSTLQELGGIGHNSINLWCHLKKFIDCDITDYRYLKRLPRILKRGMYLGLASIEPLKQKYDVIHYQNYYTPRLFGKTKAVTTIHDLGGLELPAVYQSWYNAYFRSIIAATVKRSDALILPSEVMRENLLNRFPKLEKSRTHICRTGGLRPIFFHYHPMVQDLDHLDLRPHSYFLFIGNLENRKNIPFLISQFIEARKQSLLSKHTKLVLVGKKGIGYERFEHFISEDNNIIYLGRLSDEHLVLLYKFCKAFLFPSLFEGFGVPILEAMSQHVPILISNIPSSVELNRANNNQCFVFEPDDGETLRAMLSHLDKNHATITAGLDYGDLSVYSYDDIAKEHARIYQDVIHN